MLQLTKLQEKVYKTILVNQLHAESQFTTFKDDEDYKSAFVLFQLGLIDLKEETETIASFVLNRGNIRKDLCPSYKIAYDV